MATGGKEKPQAAGAKRKGPGAPAGPRTYDPAKHCGAQRPNQPKGVLCKRGKGQGTDHPGSGRCDRHLGGTRTHNDLAEREAAKRACSLLGLDVPVETEPGAVLLDEMTRTQRAIDHYATEIAVKAAAGQDITGLAELGLFNAERKHLTDVTARALGLGLARRRLEMDEDQARQLSAILTAFAVAMKWDPAAPEVRRAGREALQLVAGGQAAAGP